MAILDCFGTKLPKLAILENQIGHFRLFRHKVAKLAILENQIGRLRLFGIKQLIFILGMGLERPRSAAFEFTVGNKVNQVTISYRILSYEMTLRYFYSIQIISISKTPEKIRKNDNYNTGDMQKRAEIE